MFRNSAWLGGPVPVLTGFGELEDKALFICWSYGVWDTQEGVVSAADCLALAQLPARPGPVCGVQVQDDGRRPGARRAISSPAVDEVLVCDPHRLKARSPLSIDPELCPRGGTYGCCVPPCTGV